MPARKTPTSFTGVVATGDRVKSLEALRDVLAARLQATDDDRTVAPISKRLSEVMAELESLSPPKVESRVDELAAERAKRRATVSDAPTGSVKRRARGRTTAPGSKPAT